jgi:hypothetical protein
MANGVVGATAHTGEARPPTQWAAGPTRESTGISSFSVRTLRSTKHPPRAPRIPLMPKHAHGERRHPLQAQCALERNHDAPHHSTSASSATHRPRLEAHRAPTLWKERQEPQRTREKPGHQRNGQHDPHGRAQASRFGAQFRSTPLAHRAPTLWMERQEPRRTRERTGSTRGSCCNEK